MQPVHISKRNSLPESSSTTVLKTIDVEFQQYHLSEALSVDINNVMGDTSEEESSSNNDELATIKKYVMHGIISPLRNRVANEILKDDTCKKAYKNVLGEKVSEKPMQLLSNIHFLIINLLFHRAVSLFWQKVVNQQKNYIELKI